jgi:hypothetical protein
VNELRAATPVMVRQYEANTITVIYRLLPNAFFSIWKNDQKEKRNHVKKCYSDQKTVVTPAAFQNTN